MARLRNPSTLTGPPIFIPPTNTNTSATRTSRSTSPRKIIHESPSTRELRYTSTLMDAEDSLLVPKQETSPVRKQRVLRPVASNSRLLRKLSDESLAATPDKKEKRRVRERRTEADDGASGFGLGSSIGAGGLYSRTLAKSLAGRGRSRGKLSVEIGMDDVEIRIPKRIRSEGQGQEQEQEVVMDDEQEKSILCDEVEGLGISDEDNKENIEVVEEDEDDEPVVDTRRRRQPHARRRIVSSSSEDEDEEENVKRPVQKPSMEMPPPLTSMRPPFRKGNNQIASWAQEVIDLTDLPDATSSMVLDPPVRMRTASFAASSRPGTSSSDAAAMLHFSPTPTKQRSPRKAPPISRPSTPPAPLSPSKLVSPSKKNPRIPHAPNLRPSIDAFWDPEVVNNWTDKFSPSKPLMSPRKQKLFQQLEAQMEGICLSDDGSEDSYPSPKISPKKLKERIQTPGTIKKSAGSKDASAATPTVSELRAQRKDFAARKHTIAESFVTELDNTITGGRIASLSESTGGIKLVWSRTLKTTAGRANWRREQIHLRTGTQPSDVKLEVRHHCSIELAEKVIDDEERLYNVLAHEYCHLTNFMISEVRNNPHGAEFKSWGAKVTKAFQHKGVEVTTKHSYKIEYKYVWECVSCGYEFKRHSKSVDPVRHSCGKCKGKLVQTKPTPRNVAAKDKDGKAAPPKKSDYQVFVKEHFARVKREMAERDEDTQMGKVMAAVAKEYKSTKSKKVEINLDEIELEPEEKGKADVKVDELGLVLEGLNL